MSNKEPFSIRSRMKSFGYAFSGIRSFFLSEHNSRIQAVAALLVVLLGYLFQLNKYEWGMIVIAIGMVIIAEMFNTAIEHLTDMVSPEYHPKAKVVKDIAAGAVLMAGFVSVVLAIIVFGSKMLAILYGYL